MPRAEASSLPESPSASNWPGSSLSLLSGSTGSGTPITASTPLAVTTASLSCHSPLPGKISSADSIREMRAGQTPGHSQGEKTFALLALSTYHSPPPPPPPDNSGRHPLAHRQISCSCALPGQVNAPPRCRTQPRLGHPQPWPLTALGALSVFSAPLPSPDGLQGLGRREGGRGSVEEIFGIGACASPAAMSYFSADVCLELIIPAREQVEQPAVAYSSAKAICSQQAEICS